MSSIEITPETTGEPLTRKSVIRIWPLVLILLIQGAAVVVTFTPAIDNFTRFMTQMTSVLVSLILFLIYWTFFSKLSKWEKVLVPLCVLTLPVAVGYLCHRTIYFSLWSYGIPFSLLMILVGLVLMRNSGSMTRLSTVICLMVLGYAWYPFVKIEGLDGNFHAKFTWRNAPTAEEQLLKTSADQKAEQVAVDNSDEAWLENPNYDWPNFRGPKYNSKSYTFASNKGTEFSTLKELWRIKIGPGWSLFIKVGKRLYTQEQRGPEELVTCYDAESGKLLWNHVNNSRFDEVVSGAGPRATPSYHAGKIYAYGGKGILSCLEARTGNVIWERDLYKEYEAALPQWGFSSSPTIMKNLVIVYVDGKDPGAGWVALDLETGKEVWKLADDGMNYTTAYPLNIDGYESLLLACKEGWKFVEPASGNVQHTLTPEGWQVAPLVQPQYTEEKHLLLPFGDGLGVECYDVHTDGKEWSLKKKWRTNKLRPSFNDFVADANRVCGFNQNMFTCVKEETGELFWKKKGRYGFGQVLEMQLFNKLLVQGETGEIVILEILADDLIEVAKFPGPQGKTWNHPIAAEGYIYLRNGEEAVCYEIIGK